MLGDEGALGRVGEGDGGGGRWKVVGGEGSGLCWQAGGGGCFRGR